MKSFLKFSTLTITVVAMMIFVSGCSSSSPNTAEDVTPDVSETVTETITETTVETDSNYPLIIEHAFGETVLESKPERIATIFWGNHDVPLALGVVPVGISKANYGVTDGSGLLPWTIEGFNNLGVDSPVLFDDVSGLDFEAINAVKPDVILAAYSGITQEDYDLLSQIAPVVAYPTVAWQTSWRDQILINSKGMGMQAEGEALVKELEQLIVDRTADYPQLKDKTAAFLYFSPTDLGTFYVYLPSDPRASYLVDLGMSFPDSLLELAKGSNSFALEISAENVDVLQDVDIIVTYGDDSLLATLQSDPLIGLIPAIEQGSVAIVTDGTPLAASGTPSALSIPATIDDFLEVISKAADHVK